MLGTMVNTADLYFWLNTEYLAKSVLIFLILLGYCVNVGKVFNVTVTSPEDF